MMFKQIVLALILSLGLSDDITRIAKINNATREAEKAFKNKDYETAIEKYSYLLNTLGVDDDKALLNLGHAYFHSGKIEDAHATYTLVTSSEDPLLRSIAWQQLAVLDYQRKDIEKALYHCKQALKANPANEEARINYELLKKMERPKNDQQQQQKQQEEKKDQKQDQQKQQQDKQEKQEKQEKKDQDQNNTTPQSEEQKNGQQEQKQKEAGEKEQKENKQKQESSSEQDKKDQQQENKGKDSKQQQQQEAEKGKKEGEKDKMVVDRQQLERMNLTEEKARMLLDAMRQKEVQYIQQKQHKGSSKPDKSKPDW